MKVFFATPSYDGRVDTYFASALVNTMTALQRAPIDCVWLPWSGCCYLPTARNRLVAEFLATDCTDLVFLDSDVYWDPAAMTKLLTVDCDLAGGIYPLKRDHEEYPVWIKTAGDPPLPRTATTPEGETLIECWGLPTGFLRIRRRVFEVMRARGLAPEAVENDSLGNETGRYDAYFDTGFLEAANPHKWWGEDFWFCWKWGQCGGTCWAVPDMDLHHIGAKAYRGNYDRYLRRLPGGADA